MGPIMKSALVLLSFAFIIYIVEGEATGNKTFLLETKGDKKENGKYGQDYKGDEADYQYGDDEDLGLDDDITFDEAHEEDEGSPTLLEAASSTKIKMASPNGLGQMDNLQRSKFILQTPILEMQQTKRQRLLCQRCTCC